MAIEKDKLIEILSGDNEVDSKATELLNIIREDFESQFTAIKLNREDIKKEKTEEIAKRHAVEEKLESLKAENERLVKQLKDASSDEIQKIWEQKLQDATNIHVQKVTELEEKIENQKEEISILETARKRLECIEEFNKAIQGKNIATDALEDFKEYVLGENCYKFSLKPTGDGDKKIYATKDGLTIKQVTEQACQSTFGKNCIMNNNSGGGAGGGARDMHSKDNPFISGNITEQARLYRENRDLYESYKKLAGK
jgi:predicted nuclease with TOPRIM domain